MMTQVISDPMRTGRAALAVTVMLGVLALAAALASLPADGSPARQRPQNTVMR